MTPAAFVTAAERLARWRRDAGWTVTVRVHDDPPPHRLWRDGWLLPRCDNERAQRLRDVVQSDAPDAALLLGDGLALAHGAGGTSDDLSFCGGSGRSESAGPSMVSRIGARSLWEAMAAIENIVAWESGDAAEIPFRVSLFGEASVDGQSDVASTLECAGLLRVDARGDRTVLHEVPWSAGDLVLYRGHGGPDGPSTPALSAIAPPSPGRPIVAAFLGCSMGLERDESPSIASRLLCTPGGAVGVIAAVHLTAVDADRALFEALGRIAIEASRGAPYTLSEWLRRARLRVVGQPPADLPTEELHRSLGCYRVFGDPTITLPSTRLREPLHGELL